MGTISVEYLTWIDDRWYGCVKNYDSGAWETTDVGAYDENQAYRILADAEAEGHENTLQFIPRGESPL